MSATVLFMSMSLDGFIAGPNGAWTTGCATAGSACTRRALTSAAGERASHHWCRGGSHCSCAMPELQLLVTGAVARSHNPGGRKSSAHQFREQLWQLRVVLDPYNSQA